MNTKEIKSFAKSVQLTSIQKEVLTGLLLGDGHLETQNQGRTFRLKVEHSIIQKDYVDWLYTIYKNIILTEPQIKKQIINGKTYQKYWFSTISIESMSLYGNLFYKSRKKIVPKNISHMISCLSLAIWFMDDGSLKSQFHKARIINTQCFSKNDLSLLQNMLLSKFHIHTTLRNQQEGMQIYIPSQDSKKFLDLIRTFVIPSMEYKLS